MLRNTAHASPTELALVAFGQALLARGYRYTAVSAATHLKVNGRKANLLARSLPDVFGWGRLFPKNLLSPEILALAEAANVLGPVRPDGHRQARLLFATVETDGHPLSFWHLGFGPQHARYARLLRTLSGGAFTRVAELGAPGVGVAALAERSTELAR